MPPEAVSLFVGLAWLLGQAGTIILIYSRLRRQPPINEDLARNYVTKPDLATAINERRDICMRTHDQLDIKLHADRGESKQIEAEQFALIRAGHAELRRLIEDLQRGISAWQRGIERQIGKLESKGR